MYVPFTWQLYQIQGGQLLFFLRLKNFIFLNLWSWEAAEKKGE